MCPFLINRFLEQWERAHQKERAINKADNKINIYVYIIKIAHTQHIAIAAMPISNRQPKGYIVA
jgi:hypothetical protein